MKITPTHLSSFLRRILAGGQSAVPEPGEIYRKAIQSCPLPVLLHAEDGQIICISDSWKKLTGYGEDELKTIADWTRLAYGEGGEKIADYILSLHSLKQPVVEGRYTVRAKDGGAIIWEFSSSPLGKLPDGRRYTMSIAVDRTEYADKESELQLVKKALDCASNSVLITDRNGNILYANDAVLRTSGHSIKDVIGNNPRIFKSGLHQADFYRNMWQTLLKGNSFIAEMTNRHKEGFLVHEEAMITPILEDNGAVTHFIAIKTDLTEKKELQSELYHALDQALEASQAKSRLLARVSHELRTPMNGIMGMNQLLQLSELDEEQKEMSQTIDNCSQSMMTIIEDLLSVTALDSKQLAIERQVFNLRESLNKHMRQWIQNARARNLHLSLHIADTVPETVEGDEHRIFQILSSLALNSIKFSNSGNIAITIDMVRDQKTSGTRFLVSDEGIGVPDHFVPHLFEPFRQAEEFFTRRYGGLGLGLAIAQRLARAMGSDLNYEPNAEHGSRFFFTLDLASHDAKSTPKINTVQNLSRKSRPHHLLLVEDSQDNQIVICRMLHHLGYTVSSAYNGREALDQLTSTAFDLVLLDCHMPVMDGIEAARAIRSFSAKTGSRTRTIPLIALTADVRDGFKPTCIEAGMNDFLAKPVSLDLLERMLNKWLNSADSKTEPDSAVTDLDS